MAPEITHGLGISATRCAQAGASPLIGKLDPMGLGRSVPRVLMGGKRGTPSGCVFCLCQWDRTNSPLAKGPQPTLHAPRKSLSARNLCLFRMEKEDRHLSCQWHQGLQQRKMPKKTVPITLHFQHRIKTVNTSTRFAQLQLRALRRVQVCLLRLSVALQTARALPSRKQRFPTAGTQAGRDRKGPADGTAPSPEEKQLGCRGYNGL